MLLWSIRCWVIKTNPWQPDIYKIWKRCLACCLSLPTSCLWSSKNEVSLFSICDLVDVNIIFPPWQKLINVYWGGWTGQIWGEGKTYGSELNRITLPWKGFNTNKFCHSTYLGQKVVQFLDPVQSAHTPPWNRTRCRRQKPRRQRSCWR